MNTNEPQMNADDLFRLDGHTVLIPGGYGGIGEAVAWALAKAGARVAIAGRDGGKARALAALINDAGHDAIGLAMDARDVASIQAGVDGAAQMLGGLTILVNCVGGNREQKIADVTEDTFDEIYRTNLKSAMFLAQAVARHQIAGAKGGKQIHMLSVRSQLGMRDYGYSAYCATKGALVMLVKQHALELAPHGILVNGIAPTVVITDASEKWRTDPGRWDAFLARVPLGRAAEPRDVVGATLFFCSRAADFVTGQVLYIDGGITASQ